MKNILITISTLIILSSCSSSSHVEVNEFLSSSSPELSSETNGGLLKTKASFSQSVGKKRRRLDANYSANDSSAEKVDSISSTIVTTYNLQFGLHQNLDLVAEINDMMMLGLQFQFLGKPRTAMTEGYSASVAYLYGEDEGFGISKENTPLTNTSGSNGIDAKSSAELHKVLLSAGYRLSEKQMFYLKSSYSTLSMSGSIDSGGNRASFDKESSMATATVVGYQLQRGPKREKKMIPDGEGNYYETEITKEIFKFSGNVEIGAEHYKWNTYNTTTFVAGLSIGVFFY